MQFFLDSTGCNIIPYRLSYYDSRSDDWFLAIDAHVQLLVASGDPKGITKAILRLRQALSAMAGQRGCQLPKVLESQPIELQYTILLRFYCELVQIEVAVPC